VSWRKTSAPEESTGLEEREREVEVTWQPMDLARADAARPLRESARCHKRGSIASSPPGRGEGASAISHANNPGWEAGAEVE
jgi:hypothetical protein